ncbi:hypothetical protein BJ875DRAFT_219625 [Amylocarpus encephaloides]|uniref:Uncharacterized protein n=1 Tax=Amylocarpus encephaloides TaxID=45428 RepID=A0A9P8C0F9_9HELO|nr:hypothetical protein BJ875DRAFT_219625 [Amylocarpus encephaloides]
MSSGIVLDVNYIPRFGRSTESKNWPVNGTQHVCGIIPSSNAQCYTDSLLNVGKSAPRTFESCCNGPIVNITSAVTDPSDPSYGAQCLAYCPVDYVRTLEGGRIDFGDYWDCITEGDTSTDHGLNGDITCGFMGDVDTIDKCHISISVVSLYSATATSTKAPQTWYIGNSTATSAMKETPTCPARRTSDSVTMTPTPTTTASSGAWSVVNNVRFRDIVGVTALVALTVAM